MRNQAPAVRASDDFRCTRSGWSPASDARTAGACWSRAGFRQTIYAQGVAD